MCLGGSATSVSWRQPPCFGAGHQRTIRTLPEIREFSGRRCPVSPAKGVSPMDDTPSAQTSPTLLGRLRQQPSDQAAWEQFVERYGRLILAWCRQARLQDADTEDVTQIVLIQLADK